MSLERLILDVVERAVRETVREELARDDRKAKSEGGYLTLNDAAAFAAVSKSTLRKWIRDGDLPTCRHKGVVRVRKADVAALLSPDYSDDVIDFASRALDLSSD